jgi:GT2 family glycosyltransferase
MISLIICTYKRPESLFNLLFSISKCKTRPFEILIIDASTDRQTEDMITGLDKRGLNIKYYLVEAEYRGLTRQRNFGIRLIDLNCNIVAFLDDDVIVEPDYFEKIEDTYNLFPDAVGVGGVDLKNNEYFRKEEGLCYSKFNYYELDGWIAKEPLRYKVRKLAGLMTNLQPGLIPEYSNGRSSLPPNGKIYEVEHLTGMSMSFRTKVFEKGKFSSFFEGYGLYEDFDFCVRVLSFGKLYVNTNAKVWHLHEVSGRPDFFKYGKMVVRNGWYVWRVRFPHPSIKARIKWHLIMLLLANIRLMNILTGPDRSAAFCEFCGRMVSWLELLIIKPNVIR